MGAIASTQPGWVGAQLSFAQDRPGTVSTSARDLGSPLKINCKPNNPDGIPEQKPIFCGVGDGEKELGSAVYPIPEDAKLSIQPINLDSLFDFMRVSSRGCQPSQDRVVLFCAPVF